MKPRNTSVWTALWLSGFFLLSISLSAQVWVPPNLDDDFSNANLWSPMGTPIQGNLSVTGGKLKFDAFGGGQDFRLVRNIQNVIPDPLRWRMLFVAEIDNPSNGPIGGVLMSLTSQDLHFRNDANGSPTNQSTIEVIVANPVNANGDYHLRLSSKHNLIRSNSAEIPIQNSRTYYLEVQRPYPDQLILGVFSNGARTQHIPGSPVCYTIDPGLTDLNYLQTGVYNSSSLGRRLTAEIDNLRIFPDIRPSSCLPACNLEQQVSISNNGCEVTVTDNSVGIAGTEIHQRSVAIFSDGTTLSFPTGGSVSHTLSNAVQGRSVTVRSFGIDAEFNCCTQDTTIDLGLCVVNPILASDDPVLGEQAVLEVFPNPSHRSFTIRAEAAISSYQILNLEGKVIARGTGRDQQSFQIDTSHLANGLYFVEAQILGKKVRRKLLVRHQD